jgi:DNA-binding XRE family transcriptional regulator
MLDVMQPYGSLDNYILSLRKQCGLSQDELALLLDIHGDRIRQFEQKGRSPELRHAIGLELIFNEPVQQVFAGVSEAMRKQIAARARAMLETLSGKTIQENAEKLDTLASLGHIDEEDFTPWRNIA